MKSGRKKIAHYYVGVITLKRSTELPLWKDSTQRKLPLKQESAKDTTKVKQRTTV